MPLFVTRGRTRRATTRGSGEGPPEPYVPVRFAAVAEALAGAGDVVAACTVAGEELAADGASLDEALTGLRDAHLVVTGGEPPFGQVLALATAWSEAVLRHLNQTSCEDPLSGLAGAGHLRSRLSELHRAAGTAPDRGTLRDSHALVLLELAPGVAAEDPWVRSLRMGGLGDVARTVFPGGETVARIGPRRIGVLAPRDDRLGRRVALLRRLAGSADLEGRRVRTWIEGLPAIDAATGALLDELARG